MCDGVSVSVLEATALCFQGPGRIVKGSLSFRLPTDERDLPVSTPKWSKFGYPYIDVISNIRHQKPLPRALGAQVRKSGRNFGTSESLSPNQEF